MKKLLLSVVLGLFAILSFQSAAIASKTSAAIFSKFSIYDTEMKQFLDKVSMETKIPRDTLSDWFYNDGMLAYISDQSVTYYPFVEMTQKKYGHRPIISQVYMTGQIFTGFLALLPKMTDHFAKDDAALAQAMTILFDEFVTKAVRQHLLFQKIQAEITTDLNDYQDKHPNLPHEEIYQFVIDKFLEFKVKMPALSQEIDDQLLVMQEYADYMKKPHEAV